MFVLSGECGRWYVDGRGHKILGVFPTKEEAVAAASVLEDLTEENVIMTNTETDEVIQSKHVVITRLAWPA